MKNALLITLLVGLFSSTILANSTPVVSSVSVSDAYWPQWQGPDKDNKSTDTGLLKKWPEGGPEMLWSVDGIGKGYSSVVIADGVIYINGMVEKEGFITAIEMDGTVKWRKPYGPEYYKSFPGARASVTIVGGKLFIFSGTGVATCLDANSGETKWSIDVLEKFDGNHLSWGYGESLLVVDDKVICTAGGEGASIVALSVNDGSEVWRTNGLSETAAYGSPAVVEAGGKKLIVQILQRHLVVVDAADGVVACKYDTKDYTPPDQKYAGGFTNTPLCHDGFIYLTSGYDSGSVKFKLSINPMELTKVWENDDLDVHHGGVVLVDGHLYGANWLNNSKGDWVCVNWDSGKTAFEEKWQGNKGSITYADGMLYCYDEKEGTVALIKATPEKLDIVSSFEITMGKKEHWAHPVVCGGVLYMRHGDVLMAYNVKK
jgi:outer membrane protein assembly factor BamB